MIHKTEAFVLRSIDFSETSQIVSLFSRELGRISVMARGARRPKSKFGSTLLPMSHIQAVLYRKEGQKIFPLSETSHFRLRRNVTRDLDKITVGLRIIELVRGLTEEHDPSPQLFDLISRSFDRVESAGRREFNILLYFQMELAALMGIAPQIVKEDVESVENRGFLALDNGSIGTRNTGSGKAASRKALRAFAILARSDSAIVDRLEIDNQTRREVTSLIDAYFRYHFDTSYPDRSEPVLNRIAELSNR